MTEVAAQPTTVEGAQSRLSELSANKEFGARLLAGDTVARAEFQKVSQLAAGLERRPGAEELMKISNQDADARHAAIFIKSVRDDGLDIRDEVLTEAITGSPMSQQEHDLAKQWLARHQADEEWGRRLVKGDPDARRDFFLATVILAADIKEATA